MIDILEKEKCSGCNACLSVCPKQCISLQVDQEGFWYPNVDVSKCIHCNLCNRVCPIETRINVDHEITAFASKNKNDSIRKSSSSGGVFSLLAQNIIKKQGLVFGAAYDSNNNVHHIMVDNMDNLYQLQGSKYLQSQIGDSFITAKKYLDEGRYVLFSGTPCHIEGLLSFLGKKYDNLVTVDLICHGVPSSKVWQKYLEEKNIKNITKINHRSKKNGWQVFSMEILGNTSYVKNLEQDEYLRGFLKDLFLRPSCYKCCFKNVSRRSDITLADFWGVRAFSREMDDDQGVSLVIVQSEKGKLLYNEIEDNCHSVSVNVMDAITDNIAAMKSVAYNEKRKAFFENLENEGFINQINKLYPFDKKEYYRRQLRRKLSKIKNNILK